MARAGEAVELAERRVDDPRARDRRLGRARPGRPVAIVDVECSAGTYVRSLARDLGEAVGQRGVPRRADADGQRAVHARRRDRARRRPRGRRRRARSAIAALLLPIDAGLDLPEVVARPTAEVAAIGRGQSIGGPAAPARLVAGRGRSALVDERRALVAIARLATAELAPDKVLVDAPAPASRPMPDGGPIDVAGVDGLRPDDGPLFVVDRRVRRHPSRPPYLLEHLVREAEARRGARPAVITFDAHPDEVLLGARAAAAAGPGRAARRLGAAGVEVVVVEHFDDALRATPYDAFVGRIAARTAPRRAR